MITGTVNADQQPIIGLSVFNTGGTKRDIEAMVDTGFNGWLTLPPAVIAALGLPWQRRGRAILADGNPLLFDIYEATVLWDGNMLTVPIDEADSLPLVGMSLMHGYELNIHAVVGGSVTIQIP